MDLTGAPDHALLLLVLLWVAGALAGLTGAQDRALLMVLLVLLCLAGALAVNRYFG